MFQINYLIIVIGKKHGISILNQHYKQQESLLPILESSQGVLLYVSSIAGIEALGAPTDYSTAKTAVMSLAKNLARKSAPDVRVNVLALREHFFWKWTATKKLRKIKRVSMKW